MFWGFIYDLVQSKIVWEDQISNYPGLFPKTPLIVYLLQQEPAILIPGGMLGCAPCN